jgi:hypothetical protein
MASEVRINATVDTGQADKNVGGLRTSLVNLGGEAKKSILTGVGLGAGVGAWSLLSDGIHEAIGFLGDSITAASDMNETVSKVGVVFGKAGQSVLDWGRNSADALGISQQKALEAAGTYGNLFVALGITGEKAAGMSTKMVNLAADLASFNNVNPEDALAALQSGLVGEVEPLRKFGVNLNDATLRQKALALGLTKTTSDVLPPAIKAQAAYALILDQTKTAQGDFGRTSSGLANTQRILAAEIENLQAEIGAALLPVIKELSSFLAHDLIPALKAVLPVIGWIAGAIFGPLITAVKGAIDGIKGLISTVNNFALDFGSMGDRVHSISDKAGADFQHVKDQIRILMDGGMGFDEAATTVETALKKTPAVAQQQGHRAVDAYMKGVTDAKPAATRTMEATATTIFSKLKAVWLSKTSEVLVSASDLPGDIADAIRKEELLPQGAFQHMLELMKQPMTEASRRAYDLGVLHSKQLAKGLKSGDPAIRLAALAAKNAATADLLSMNLNSAGQSLINTLIAGMKARFGALHTAAILAGTNISGPLQGHSPPKEGPLKDIDKWGFNIGKAWAEGITKGANLGRLGIGGGGLSGGGMAMAGGGGSQVIQLVVDGRTLAEIVNRANYYQQPPNSQLPRG